MINWAITFLLLAVVFSAIGFFGTDPEFVGQSACILAGCFFISALIALFLNLRHPRVHWGQVLLARRKFWIPGARASGLL